MDVVEIGSGVHRQGGVYKVKLRHVELARFLPRVRAALGTSGQALFSCKFVSHVYCQLGGQTGLGGMVCLLQCLREGCKGTRSPLLLHPAGVVQAFERQQGDRVHPVQRYRSSPWVCTP